MRILLDSRLHDDGRSDANKSSHCQDQSRYAIFLNDPLFDLIIGNASEAKGRMIHFQSGE